MGRSSGKKKSAAKAPKHVATPDRRAGGDSTQRDPRQIHRDLNPPTSNSYDVDAYFEVQDRWLDLEGQSERIRMAQRRAARSRDKAERSGETLLRLQMSDNDTGLGGRLLLRFSRLGGQALPVNRLKVGSPVVVSADGDDSDHGVAGVVSSRKSHTIEVACEKWPDAETYRIDLSPDETTRRRQQFAMGRMRTAEGRTRKLRDMIMGTMAIRGGVGDGTESHDDFRNEGVAHGSRLNPPQRDAVEFALSMPDIAILHGPPGTGKTTTLAEIVDRCVRRGDKVLACAPSNTAVDNLLEKLIDKMPDVVRVGHPARVFENLREHTLDQLVENDPAAAVIEDMRRELQSLLRAASKDFRGKDGRRRRGEIYAEAGRLRGHIKMMERNIVGSILDGADVICTTTTIDDDLLGDREFDVVVIDEACQCTLPGVWQAVARGAKLILAGDHLQLPPTVLNDIARREGLDQSLMQRLVDREGESIFRRLTVQYRMHESIMNFSSDYFYDGELIADASVKHHTLIDLPGVEDNVHTAPVLQYYDTAGAGYDEQIEREGLSKFNPSECNVVVQKVGELLESGVHESDIAVIAPYGAQVRRLRHRIDRRGIEIDTVDGFQGREKEVVILTMVRSNDIGEIGFLSEVRRTNVAITRAKRKLILIGDSATLGRHDFYASLLDYFEDMGAYGTVWEL